MQHTVFSHLQSEELIAFALQRDSRTQMEVELAQRLGVALDMLDEGDEEPVASVVNA